MIASFIYDMFIVAACIMGFFGGMICIKGIMEWWVNRPIAPAPVRTRTHYNKYL